MPDGEGKPRNEKEQMMRTLEELLEKRNEYAEDLDGGWEQYGDMMAEHKGEVARFGDSWPGAQVQLQKMHQGLGALEQMLRMIDHEIDERFPLHSEPSLPCIAPISPNGLWDCECSECVRLQREADEAIGF